MGVNVKIDAWKSHFNHSLKMAWEWTRVPPLFKKLIITIDPLLNLGKMGLPSNPTNKISFVEFEWFIPFKIGTTEDRSNSKI